MASNWEEELRKLLEGESPSAPPPPLPPPPIVRREPSPPPPVIVVQQPRPVSHPSQPQRSRPVPVAAPVPPLVIYTPQPVVIADDDHERHEGSGHLATMAESANAYLRGGQIHDRETERMRKVDAAIDNARPSQIVSHVRTSPEVAAVVKLLRQPQTARQVMLASFILSPPKAFES